MRARTLLLPHVAVSVALSGLLSAQVSTPSAPVRITRTLPVELTPELVQQLEAQVVPAGQEPTADAKATQAASQRLQAFQKLQFDRRPSAILAAWAAPELKPYDPSEEQAGDAAKPGAAGEPLGDERRPASAAGGGEAVDPAGVLSADDLQKLIDQAASGAALEPPARATTNAADAPGAGATAAVAPNEAQIEQKRLQREMEMLQRDVTLGRWQKVAAFFASLPEKDREGAYKHFLTVLPRHPTQSQQRVPPNLQEKNRFSFEEAFVLAGMAPGGFDKKQCKLVAPIVRRALDDGSVMEEFIRLLEVEVSKPDAEQRLDRREAAVLLSELKFDLELGAFLPTADEAEADDDREALNLLARHALAKYRKEQRREWLGVAWQVTQAVLAKGEVDKEEKQEALRRAVELAPKVHDDLGPAWLAESFTSRPERGMEIIATIGGQVATGFAERARDADYRAAGLKLQKTAVEALLETAPELAEQWRPTLGLLAAGWIVEADYSRQFSQTVSWGPVMERDAFGNIFWSEQRRGGGGNVAAVEPDDLMAAQPGGRWADLLSDELRPHFTTVSAQLWLKVNEHQKAFPYIEQLAGTNPRKAKELAEEFLRVWMRNNNPNTNNRTSSYMFSFGFNQRANGIPLTRSKQQRNLDDLAGYVDRLRALDLSIDESLLGDAFVAAHSVAEVYRLETIERVFGDVGDLSPMLLSHLLGKMRTNLATIWRVPAVQEQEKTRRSQKQMLAEVARGYDVALEIAESASDNSGGHWALQEAVAAILHDKNNFAKEQARSSDFAENRKAAFEKFREAADSYAAIVETLALDEESAMPYTVWFYAALGACDLGGIDEEAVVAKGQLELIKEAMADLPDEARERHQGMFASLLFTRMSAVRPQIKFRYLQAGFEIVGDDPRAAEAKKLWDYYQDLVRELKVEAVVDGATAVGTEPFGVRVDIVHSQEIERESGGFQKYATNQNNQPYAYNYGRPLENYRDKFHDAAISALQEHFEILSVTFNSEKMESVRDVDPEWRRTPYAYLLLQARGPQIDRIPTIKLDFDFNDTSGFMILPIGSAPVAIDASTKVSAPRPFGDIEVNQLLDERKIDEGKVTLEIKAKCKGLVPDLDEFLELETPGFQVTKRDDQGAAVVRFSDDGERVESERVWLLALEPAAEGARPGNFRFGKPTREGVRAVYQRYDDADLQTVDAEVALRRVLVTETPWWAWLLLGLAVVGYLVWFLFAPSSGRDPDEGGAVLRMPQQVTPFTVLALLQAIASRREFADAQRAELESDIRRIEAAHFGRGDAGELDLEKIANSWLRQAG